MVKGMSLLDAMSRAWAEIERNLHSAEVYCDQMVTCEGCDFKDATEPCKLVKTREIIGEHPHFKSGIAVVHVLKCVPPWGQIGDVYIGRANAHYNLPQSPWHNPYVMINESTRDEVIGYYDGYLEEKLKSGELRLEDLKDAKRLGCWCFPKNCHGDILKQKLEEL